MHARDLDQEDHHAFQELKSLSFGGRPRPGESDFPPGLTAIGIDAPDGSGQLAAGATILHEQMGVHGALAGCGAVGNVAVHPAYRGGGAFSTLLTEVISRGTALGHAFSMLYPSHAGIYRRRGYQSICRIQRLIVPLTSLATIPEVPGRRLAAVTEESFPTVRSLYSELVLSSNGLLSRENPAFGGESLPAAPWNAVLVLDEAGTAQGYLSFARTPEGPGGTDLEVFDVVGRERSDVSALLRSLSSWSTVADSVLLRMLPDDPALDVIPGGRLRPDPRAIPEVMLRVLDTAAALSARPAPEGLEGSLRLVVEDLTVPEGTSRAAADLRVTIRDGLVSTARSAPGDADLACARLDVHSASLLLAGGRTLADARRMGLSADSDPEAETVLDRLLAGPRPGVLDFF